MGGDSARARDQHMAALLEDAFAGRQTLVASTGPSLGRSVVSKLSPIGRAEAAPAVKRPAAEGSVWAIQVGAYAKQAQANKAAQDATTKVPQTQGKGVLVLSPYKSDKQKVFRARLTGFSEKEAKDACRALQQKQTSCAIIAPSS
jgi:D-alanyl-D-alanine carboxypeptidase